MKNKRKKKIHRDKNGREFIKESYFVGGKMKFRRIYVIDGIPAEELHEIPAEHSDLLDKRLQRIENGETTFKKWDLIKKKYEDKAL